MVMATKFWVGALSWLTVVLVLAARNEPTVGQLDAASASEAQRGPDGILYRKDDRLWLMSEEGAGKRQVPNTIGARHGVCTPNGRRILFANSGPASFVNVYAVNRDGSGLVRATERAYVASRLSPSPDGRHVAFVDGASPDRRKAVVYDLDLESNRLAALTAEFRDCGAPAWSPDGARIAFVAARERHDDTVYLMDLKSGDVRPSLKVVQTSVLVGLSWSSDGKFLAVAAWPAIWLINTETLAATPVPLPSGVRATSVAWSPTEPMLAFGSEAGCDGNTCGDIYTLRPDGSVAKKVSNTKWFHCRCYRDPRWSPDGSKLVTTAYRSRHGDMDFNPFHRDIPDNVYVIDLVDTRERNVDDDEGRYSDDPTWCGKGEAPAQGD